MMPWFRARVAVAAIIALVATVACSGTTPTESTPSGTAPGSEPTPAVAGATAVAPTGGGTVQVRIDPSLGQILTDSSGRTLYKFDRDNKSLSNCTGDCATNWPPVLQSSGQPSAPQALKGSLGTFPRPEGGRQVAYEGTPLYTYAGDAEPGDVTGDGVGGVWHVVHPVT